MDPASQQLEDSAVAFVTPMRMGEGFNEEHFERFKAALRDFHTRWADSDMLPRSAVVSLIDLPRIVEACAPFYRGAERQRIIDASVELVDVILEGF